MYVPMKVLLDDANKNNYAVIAANGINLEMARAIISAAAEENAPIIVNIGQGQMTKHADGELMSCLIRMLAERVKTPVALNLDHGRDYERITYAFRHGFSSLMIDASKYPLEENIRITKEIVRLAHSQGVTVEAELGHVGSATAGDQDKYDLYTDPLEAKRFVEETNVDALAVAIGTAHGNYPGGLEPKIDFDRLKAIKDMVQIPLVLHGGSGSGDDNIKKAVEYGINKINVFTDASNACKKGMAEALQKNPNADFMSIMMSAEKECKEIIKHFIRLAGSSGKAAV